MSPLDVELVPQPTPGTKAPEELVAHYVGTTMYLETYARAIASGDSSRNLLVLHDFADLVRANVRLTLSMGAAGGLVLSNRLVGDLEDVLHRLEPILESVSWSLRARVEMRRFGPAAGESSVDEQS